MMQVESRVDCDAPCYELHCIIPLCNHENCADFGIRVYERIVSIALLNVCSEHFVGMEDVFVVDPLSVCLARGERPPTWGLNTNAFQQSQLGPAFAKAYKEWAGRAKRAFGDSAYVYPLEHLHITVAPPAPFIPAQEVDQEDDRIAFERVWLRVMMHEIETNDLWPRAPFELIYDELSLDSKAGIFLIKVRLHCWKLRRL
jgi:hypothetical protein